MTSDMEMRTKQKWDTEFVYAEKIALIDVNRRLLNVYGDLTVDVNAVVMRQ